ncbi:MAG: hypothetical protein JWO33_2662 [Caulobacteraceae bacterium]|nr:hypothetical protein [Caulobacteraceae bacterium]
MTEQNRDEPPAFGGGWDAPGGDEPAPMSLGAWPKADAPPGKLSGEFADTGPIELPSRLKAVAARWDRPAAPARPKPKPPAKRFFTPLSEPTFGRPQEPELPSAPLNPVAEVTGPAAAPTWLTGRSIFWACLLGVVIGGIAAVLLDVVQLRRAPQMLRTPLINAPPPAKPPQPAAVPEAVEKAAVVRGAKRPVPRIARRRDEQGPVYYGPPPRITVLNAPPSVVVLRPSPPAPDPAPAPNEP